MIRKIQPIRITNHNSCHQPERPVSWSRRAPTASDGNSTARLARLWIRPAPDDEPVPMIASTMLATIPSRKVKSTHHQNSERRARPEKTMYLLKHVLTASANDTGPPMTHGCDQLSP